MLHRSTLFLFVLACLIAVRAHAAEPGGAAVIETFHETLTGVMKESEELGFNGRRAHLEPVIRESFDLAFISRLVSGRFWDSMDQEQQEQMIRTFTELTVATYASRFDGYAGEVFKIVETRSLKKDRLLVRSELIPSNGDAIQLDYMLHQYDGRWLIINVIADGVSDLSIKRADYASVISVDGFDGLISRISAQIDEMSESS